MDATRDTSDQGHTDRPRGTRGRFTQRAGTAQRDAQACRLRVTGATYDQIAKALEFHDRSGARRAVQRALATTVREPAEELLALEQARLDELTRTLNRVLGARHYVVSAGGKVVLGPDGEPLTDHGAIVHAALALLRVHESRRRLLGTDAPPRVRVEIIDDEVIRALAEEADRDIERFELEAARHQRALPPGGHLAGGSQAPVAQGMG
jgi:Arc/MetJ family transcription regulator